MTTATRASETKTAPTRITRIAGLLLLVAPIQYWILEAITAGAWKSPSYRYDVNFISDLGVAVTNIRFEGRLVTSPLHDLMNLSFALLGLLVIAGSILLFRSRAPQRGRTATLVVGIVFGVGALLVAGFPENTIQAAHLLGAVFNIAGGNILAILFGAAGARLGFPRALSGVLIGLGVLGLIAMVGVLGFPALSNGAVERVAAYSYMLAFLGAGLALLVGNRRSVAPSETPAAA